MNYKSMVDDIRNLEEAMGNIDSPRQITQGEMINRENLAKSLVANDHIKKGQVITRDLISIKSPWTWIATKHDRFFDW